MVIPLPQSEFPIKKPHSLTTDFDVEALIKRTGFDINKVPELPVRKDPHGEFGSGLAADADIAAIVQKMKADNKLSELPSDKKHPITVPGLAPNDRGDLEPHLANPQTPLGQEVAAAIKKAMAADGPTENPLNHSSHIVEHHPNDTVSHGLGERTSASREVYQGR